MEARSGYCFDCGDIAHNPRNVTSGTDTDRGWHEWHEELWFCDEHVADFDRQRDKPERCDI